MSPPAPSAAPGSGADVAIAVHVYYPDQWDDLADLAARFPGPADLYVTCRPELHPALAPRVAGRFPAAEVLAVDDLGMDVLPFLRLAAARGLDRYRAVLKLHTKNRASPDAAALGRAMVEGIGAPAPARAIAALFRDRAEVGMVGAALQVRSAHALMYGNRARVADLLGRLGIDPGRDWPFLTGTMFWIAGPLLAAPAALAEELAAEARAEAAARSGADGTLAHAMERVFGALVTAAGRRLWVTERAAAVPERRLLLPLEAHGPANADPVREADYWEIAVRDMAAAETARLVRSSPLFDAEGYRARAEAAGLWVPGIEPAYHHALWGDHLGLDPGPDFDATHYLLARGAACPPWRPALADWRLAGRAAGIPARRGADDWLALARREGAFDPGWYARRYPDAAGSGLGAAAHYRDIGQPLRRPASPAFDPRDMPALAEGEGAVDYLRRHARGERRLYDLLWRAFVNGGDRAPLADHGRRLEAAYGAGPGLLAAFGTAAIEEGDWPEARRRWRGFAAAAAAEAAGDLGRRSPVAFDRPTPPPGGLRIAADARVPLPVRLPGRIAVYTASFGDMPGPLPVADPVPGVDYLCFTDRDRVPPGWQRRRHDAADPAAEVRRLRALPHEHLGDHDASLWVAPDTLFLGRAARLLALCAAAGDLVLWRHPAHPDAYRAAAAALYARRGDPDAVLDRIERYAGAGLPRGSGLYETATIWRRHGAEPVRALMRDWLDEAEPGSGRISLGFLAWRGPAAALALPDSLGAAGDNEAFRRIVPPAPGPPGIVPGTEPGTSASPAPAPAPRPAPRDIAVLCAPGPPPAEAARLADLAAAHYRTERRVELTGDAEVAGRILIATEAAWRAAGAARLADLARRNLVIAEVPDVPPPEIAAAAHALVAGSLSAWRDLLAAFPGRPAFHLTRPPDPALPERPGLPADRLRAAASGRDGALADPEVARRLAAGPETGRPADLLAVNLHLAPDRGREGGFRAGFVAARLGANLMVRRGARDALYYLGGDYPYLLDDDAGPAEIAAALDAAAAGFGGPDWRHGLAVMDEVRDRSSPARTLADLDAMLAAL